MSTTHCKGNLAIQAELFTSTSPKAASAFSAPYKPIQTNASRQQEDAYLCAWLRSRLALPLLTLREDSALTATASDQAQVYRLAALARRRHLNLNTGTRHATRKRVAA